MSRAAWWAAVVVCLAALVDFAGFTWPLLKDNKRRSQAIESHLSSDESRLKVEGLPPAPSEVARMREKRQRAEGLLQHCEETYFSRARNILDYLSGRGERRGTTDLATLALELDQQLLQLTVAMKEFPLLNSSDLGTNLPNLMDGGTPADGAVLEDACERALISEWILSCAHLSEGLGLKRLSLTRDPSSRLRFSAQVAGPLASAASFLEKVMRPCEHHPPLLAPSIELRRSSPEEWTSPFFKSSSHPPVVVHLEATVDVPARAARQAP